MNDRIEDGGPAYPFPEVRDPVTGCGIMQGASGMSLRDWFAGQALAGFLASGPHDCELDGIAHDAYLAADAMLDARKGGQS